MFRDHYGLVVGVARCYSPSRDLVDDIVQQVYLDFIDGMIEKKWDIKRNAGGLLCQIAKRKSQMLWRERGIHSQAVQRLAEMLTDSFVADEDPEHYEHLKDEILAMRLCLDKLPPKSRQVVNRHYFERIPVKEIAEEQQVKPAMVRLWLHRIRLKLKTCILRTIQTAGR